MLFSFIVSAAGLFGSGTLLYVAAMFVPSVAALLKSALDFLRSPLGTILGVGALGVFLYVSGWIGGDIHGTRETRAEWRADTAAKEKAQAARELALRLEMKREAEAALATDAAFGKSIDEKVQKNEAENVDRSACRAATGADIERLRSLDD
jgi:hypothetical protein